MKIKIICIGKTGKDFLEAGEQEYLKRLKHYIQLERIELPDLKNQKSLSTDEIKRLEGEKMKALVSKEDQVYLLDDKGKQFTSLGFSEFLQRHFNHSKGNLVFLIGGAFGFSPEIYALANGKISLSSLTFSHQMVRMIFAEQIYRAMTILKGEKYHHE